jgi:hypothetical protein
MQDWEREFILTGAQQQVLLAVFDTINQTQTRPDGTSESMVAYIDEHAAVILANVAYPPKTYAMAKRCREIAAKIRASDDCDAKLMLGMQYGQLLSSIGPVAEGNRLYLKSELARVTGLGTRRANREKVKGAARRFIANGRTDVLDQLEAEFRMKFTRRTLAEILREVRRDSKNPGKG